MPLKTRTPFTIAPRIFPRVVSATARFDMLRAPAAQRIRLPGAFKGSGDGRSRSRRIPRRRAACASRPTIAGRLPEAKPGACFSLTERVARGKRKRAGPALNRRLKAGHSTKPRKGALAMELNTDRIRTTHAGSLPRPDDLVRMMWDKLDGKPVDEAKLSARVRQAVAEVVKRQREAGIDLISDGEMSKPGFSNYVAQRYTGFADKAEFRAADLA